MINDPMRPPIRLALYQPDIPQNTGAAMRLASCMGVPLEIIEPCGFLLDEKKVRRSSMDYAESLEMNRHSSWGAFLDAYQGKHRIVLLSTKADVPYTSFEFKDGDILLVGQESAGVPDDVHNTADARIIIPMPGGGRSLNVINALSMVTGEAARQLGHFAA